MQCKKDSFCGRAALGIKNIPVKKEHAFTLLELLVVIANIGLLLSIVVPSLKKVKDTAAMKLSVSNARQIMLASAIYSNDNQEQVPRSTIRFNQEDDELANKFSWICPPVINPSVSPTTEGDFVPAAAGIQATFEQRLAGIRYATLYPYLGDTEVYNRPRDFYEIARLPDNFSNTTKVL